MFYNIWIEFLTSKDVLICDLTLTYIDNLIVFTTYHRVKAMLMQRFLL